MSGGVCCVEIFSNGKPEKSRKDSSTLKGSSDRASLNATILIRQPHFKHLTEC